MRYKSEVTSSAASRQLANPQLPRPGFRIAIHVDEVGFPQLFPAWAGPIDRRLGECRRFTGMNCFCQHEGDAADDRGNDSKGDHSMHGDRTCVLLDSYPNCPVNRFGYRTLNAMW